MLGHFKQYILQRYIKLKNLLHYLRLFCTPYQQPAKPLIAAEITNFNHGRYAFQLINYLAQAGYAIAFTGSRQFLLNLHGYDRLIFNIPGIQVIKKRSRRKEVSYHLMVNSPDKPSYRPAQNARAIHVNFDYFNRVDGKACQLVLPYYMHPVISRNYEQGNYRPANSKKGIFFYGQQDAKTDYYLLRTYFKLNSRNSVFQFLNQRLPGKFEPQTYQELRLAISKNKNEFYFLDAQRFRIPAADWLDVLSSFEFFIATPGMIMPQCHNIIEAMAMGVVPILQFPDAFYPQLQPNVNCIVFHSLEELPGIINEVLTMEDSQKIKLSKNITKYYNEHISPLSFRCKLESTNCSRLELFVNAEEKSLNI